MTFFIKLSYTANHIGDRALITKIFIN